jgi:nicotinamidase-related amidase
VTEALIVIDAQINMFEPEPAYDAAGLLNRLVSLVRSAREAGVPVVFVRNNGGTLDPDFPGSPGWDLHPRLSPRINEPVIDKSKSDSFTAPELPAFLNQVGADRVVIAGLQSEYCISATTAGAIKDGRSVVLVSDGHSTYDGATPASQTIAAVNERLASSATLETTAETTARWTRT